LKQTHSSTPVAFFQNVLLATGIIQIAKHATSIVCPVLRSTAYSVAPATMVTMVNPVSNSVRDVRKENVLRVTVIVPLAV